jgi:hypothetical protein
VILSECGVSGREFEKLKPLANLVLVPDLADTGTQSKMSTTVKSSKMARRYGEAFKRQAVELLIHSGKTQRQLAKELDVSE